MPERLRRRKKAAIVESQLKEPMVKQRTQRASNESLQSFTSQNARSATSDLALGKPGDCESNFTTFTNVRAPKAQGTSPIHYDHRQPYGASVIAHGHMIAATPDLRSPRRQHVAKASRSDTALLAPLVGVHGAHTTHVAYCDWT